jgi:hypothetical protein
VINTEKSLGYEGSEDSIRNKFHNFLKLQLVGIMQANRSLAKWTADCKDYQRKHRTHSKDPKRKEKEADYQLMLDEETDEQPRRRSEDFPPLIPNEVTAIPFPGLLQTNSFPYFLQFHNDKIPDIMEQRSPPCLLIENYDYCLILPNQEFANYNWHENRLSFGRGRPGHFEGKEIRFTEDPGHARHIYVGQVEGHRFVRNGYYLDKN